MRIYILIDKSPEGKTEIFFPALYGNSVARFPDDFQVKRLEPFLCRLQIRTDCSLAYAKKLAVIIQLFQCFVLQYLQYQPLTPFRTVGSIQGIFFTEMAQKPVPVLPGPFQPYACPGFGTELHMIFLQGPAQIFQFPLNRAFAQIHPFRQVFDRYDLVLIQHN